MFRRDEGNYREEIGESKRRRFASVQLDDEIIQFDKEWRKRQLELDNLRKELNKKKEDTTEAMREIEEIKKSIANKEVEVGEAKNALDSRLTTVGNLVHDSVPASDNEDNNEVIRQVSMEDVLKNDVDVFKLTRIEDAKKGLAEAEKELVEIETRLAEAKTTKAVLESKVEALREKVRITTTSESIDLNSTQYEDSSDIPTQAEQRSLERDSEKAKRKRKVGSSSTVEKEDSMASVAWSLLDNINSIILSIRERNEKREQQQKEKEEERKLKEEERRLRRDMEKAIKIFGRDTSKMNFAFFAKVF